MYIQKLLSTCTHAVDFWCFHDRDIAPEGETLLETNAMLDKVVEHAHMLQQRTGKRVLWGTAQLFKHPRYMHGAATSGCDDEHTFHGCLLFLAVVST